MDVLPRHTTRMVNLTNEFIRHEPCPNCGSSDARSVYSDGHTWCFVCHNRTPGDDDFVHNHTMNTNVHLKGSAERLHKRGISEKTNQFFRIFRDGNTLRFPYFTSDGVLKGIKVKNKQKDFTYEGVSTDTLFAQHLFPSSGKRIVITEGELDAASCYEAMPGWPMVSLPHGAASAKKDVQKQIPLFQGYEEIILFFDSDEAGRQATEETASILPPGKVSIARLEGYKDASDALQDGNAEAIRKAIWDAKPFRPDGIIDAKTLRNLVTTPQNHSTMSTPSKDLTRNYTGSGTENLLRLLLAVAQERHPSCATLQLTYSKKGNQLGSWNLKQVIGEQHLD